MLKKARADGGLTLRNFEAMDHIHTRMKNKADEGFAKLEPMIRKQYDHFASEKVANLHSLTLEKKRQENYMTAEKMANQKAPKIDPLAQMKEIEVLKKKYNIDTKMFKVPYSMKIKQICA